MRCAWDGLPFQVQRRCGGRVYCEAREVMKRLSAGAGAHRARAVDVIGSIKAEGQISDEFFETRRRVKAHVADYVAVPFVPGHACVEPMARALELEHSPRVLRGVRRA